MLHVYRGYKVYQSRLFSPSVPKLRVVRSENSLGLTGGAQQEKKKARVDAFNEVRLKFLSPTHKTFIMVDQQESEGF